MASTTIIKNIFGVLSVEEPNTQVNDEPNTQVNDEANTQVNDEANTQVNDEANTQEFLSVYEPEVDKKQRYLKSHCETPQIHEEDSPS